MYVCLNTQEGTLPAVYSWVFSQNSHLGKDIIFRQNQASVDLNYKQTSSSLCSGCGYDGVFPEGQQLVERQQWKETERRWEGASLCTSGEDRSALLPPLLKDWIMRNFSEASQTIPRLFPAIFLCWASPFVLEGHKDIPSAPNTSLDPHPRDTAVYNDVFLDVSILSSSATLLSQKVLFHKKWDPVKPVPLDNRHSDITPVSLHHKIKASVFILLSFAVLSVIVLETQLSLGPAINIFQHNKSLYCPTISHAFCQDRQMNELPGGKFGYKFTRPLLHHNCLYSYSHSSCSSRCTWKWFVLRKKRGWLVCICSVETKERMSWGFLRRRWHPGRSPTNLPGMCPSFCGIHHVYSTLLGNV